MDELEDHVAAVRAFNRFYTRQVGALNEGLLRSPFSLTEVRVLYELANRDQPTAAELGKELGVDAGYLSRILRSFEQRGVVEKHPSEVDGRQNLLRLTEQGQEEFDALNARSSDEIRNLLSALGAGERRRLLEAMRTIRELLGGGREAGEAPYRLRGLQPGDLGWIVHRHGVLYWKEFGWNEQFEALVAGVLGEIVQRFDARREGCWIAEREGEVVGSVFLVHGTDEVAKLRLLLVEPSARGLGIGSRLVDECVRFAREAGYRKITLWTNEVLEAARRIYARAGFRMVHSEPHESFGHELIAETWEREL